MKTQIAKFVAYSWKDWSLAWQVWKESDITEPLSMPALVRMIREKKDTDQEC